MIAFCLFYEEDHGIGVEGLQMALVGKSNIVFVTEGKKNIKFLTIIFPSKSVHSWIDLLISL
jgi:hypothetical protein